MPPRSDTIPVSSLNIRPPLNRSDVSTGNLWIKGKQVTDGAEGFWRIHDGLYDFTDFIKQHPGGEEWLQMSKGTDITEAFEVHHLSSIPEAMLSKYFVKNAETERNSPFTFHENGFYRTLKREARDVLNNLPKQAINTSNLFTDSFLIFMFLFAILATSYWNYKLAILSAFFMTFLTTAAHNYFHKKDNFRMHYFDFSLMSHREWRISHVLSHHLHTNTIDDLEIINSEPFLQLLPGPRTTLYRATHYILFLLLCAILFTSSHIKTWYHRFRGEVPPFRLQDCVPYILPLAMYIFGGRPLIDTLWMWLCIVTISSFHCSLIGYQAAHHHPDIFHDGDTPRSDKDYDWGLSQLDTVMDRKDITGSHFLVLTHFGDHAIHHLFPTLDHGTLAFLYPTVEKVCKDFNVKVRFVTQWEMVKGAFFQMLKTTPNPNPPDLLKKYD